MTDNEIIKGLKHCKDDDDCFYCPLAGTEYCVNSTSRAKAYYDLINRQKTEILRLNKEVYRLSQCLLYNESFTADFVKEFVAEIVREYPEAECYINDLCKTYGGVFE